jgi:hypothetical protein
VQEVRQQPKENIKYILVLMPIAMQFVFVRVKLKALMEKRKLLVVTVRGERYEP